MIENENESLFLTALPIEKFAYVAFMLNKLKKKAKKKMNAEQYTVYEKTLIQHNKILKTIHQDQETVTLELEQKQIYFLQFFTQSTASQVPDKGQKKILEGLYTHFQNVLKSA